MTPLHRRVAAPARFGVWVLAALVALAAPLPWRLAPWSAAPWLVIAIGCVGNALMLALLQSTPPGALRLRRETSVIVIVLGWVWLTAAAAATFGPRALIASVVGGLAIPLALRRPRCSPWIAVIGAWHPAPFVAMLCDVPVTMPQRALAAALLLGATGAAVLASQCFPATARRVTMAWLLWAAAGLATFLGAALAMTILHERVNA